MTKQITQTHRIGVSHLTGRYFIERLDTDIGCYVVTCFLSEQEYADLMVAPPYEGELHPAEVRANSVSHIV